jgi:uncharacterized protein YfaS (alpha-2-macroglobulin family)
VVAPADEKEEPFRVAEVGPTGTVPHENVEGGVWVLFNRPVIALKALAAPASSSPVLSITPRIEGTFRWYGSRLLAFEPHGPLATATEYTIAVSPSTKSLDGQTLTGESRFTFRTEALGIVAMSPSGNDVPPESCREIVVTFNFPVDLKTILPSIRLAAAGREIDFQASRPRIADPRQLGPYEDVERLVSLAPSVELPRDTDVSVSVLSGAKPRSGTYGTEAVLSAGFHTLRPLAIGEVEVFMGKPAPTAIVRFSHPIAEATAAGSMATSIPGYEVGKNLEVSGSDVYLSNLPVPFESSFSLRVNAGIQDVYGQSLGEPAEQTIQVGPAGSYVEGRQSGQRLLESRFPPVVAVEFQNVDAGSYAIGALARPFGPRLPKPATRLAVEAIPRNSRHFESFDLAPFLNDQGKGAAFLSWSFKGKFWGSDETQEMADSLVVQVTDIGASVHVASNSIVVQARSLSTGGPVAGAEVRFRKGATSVASGRTDAEGLAVLPFGPGKLRRQFPTPESVDEAELEIVSGKDRLVLRPARMDFSEWNDHEPYRADAPRPLTYLYTDRGIYRPGESVSFAGIDRDLTAGTLSQVEGRYRIELRSGAGGEKPIAALEGTSAATGRFEGRFTLSKDLEPGDYYISFNRGSRSAQPTGYAWLKVALFRRVAYSVDVSVAGGRKLMGETLEARISGKYLAGGNVAKGSWSWFWTRREIRFQPPGDSLAGYEFGHVERGWPDELTSDFGPLGGDGTVVAAQKLADGEKGRVYSYEVAATIEDVDRQAISKRASAIVFSSECQLGAKLSSGPRSDAPLYFVKKGEPFTLKVVSVDPDGTPLAPAGPIGGRLIREEWRLLRERSIGGVVDTRYERQETVERSFTVKQGAGAGAASRGAPTPADVQLSTASAGSYVVELDARDAKGRQAFTRISFYATGSGDVVWQRADERRIEIVKDKPVYAPGDTVRLLIKSPVAKGSFLVLVERDGILERRIEELAGSAPIIEIDIKEEHVPIVYVSISTSLPRTAPPSDGPDTPDFGKPRGYSGIVEIPVDTHSRAIGLAIHPSKNSYLPGSLASVTVSASWKGKPLEGAEVALVAADRGVLDLIDYHIPDPLDHFYAQYLYPDRVAHYDSRELLLDPVTWKVRDLPGGDEKGELAEEAARSGYSLRSDFNPTAVFRTGLVTGKDGSVTVSFKLPDLLTRFRTTAIGAKAELFGRAEGELLVQNPINVRAALPRAMRVGDEATAGVVLTNLDSEARGVTIEVATAIVPEVAAEGAASTAAAAVPLTVLGPSEKTVQVKPGESMEVAFALGAAAEGTARLTFTVTSDVLKERLEQTLAVETAYVRESFTIVGKTSTSLSEGLAVPFRFAGVPEEGLYLTLDSTVASALTGAVRYLETYPFDCLEQRTSKLFARVLFPELSVNAAGRLASELGALSRYANPDGGFSYWDGPAPRRSSYYATLRVAHLLALAQARKIALPADLDTHSIVSYLSQNYDTQADEDLKGYALYVLAVNGKKEKARADALARRGDGIGVVGYGFLGLARHAMGDVGAAEAILGRLKSFLRVGTRSVTLVGTVNDRLWYGGEIQAKALLLMLYARIEPDSQLVLGLASDLLEANRTGYWENTSNAGWVLQAFAEIVERGGEREADFTARVSLGSAEIARQRFQGASGAPASVHVPAERLIDIAQEHKAGPGTASGQIPLTFSLEGKGSLYYAAQFRYCSAAAGVEPRDEGIGVAAEILDERGNPVEGTDLKLGTVYRMRLVLYSSRDRAFLAVRAPIPSGAEPIDGSLATSQVVRPVPRGAEGDDAFGEDPWGPTTKVYDNEVRFFFDAFDRGRREVSFLFRTTTPGLFPTPPVQAELMYKGEVFGRTAGAVYRIAR